MRKLLSLVITFTLILSLFSCEEKEDFSHAELNIPLSESFFRVDKENYDAAFTDGALVITVTRLSFAMCFEDGIPDTMNSGEFARFWINRSNIDTEPKKYAGVDIAEYNAKVDGYDYYYLSAFYRTRYAYFVVVFATDSSSREYRRDEILRYASSVYFLYDKE